MATTHTGHTRALTGRIGRRLMRIGLRVKETPAWPAIRPVTQLLRRVNAIERTVQRLLPRPAPPQLVDTAIPPRACQFTRALWKAAADDTANEKRAAFYAVERHRRRLRNLGFGDHSLRDLRALAAEPQRFRGRLAAWELALWHADEYTGEHAAKALEWLQVATGSDEHLTRLRQPAIIAAESLEALDNKPRARSVLDDAFVHEQRADLLLAQANLAESEEERLAHINEALALHHLTPVVLTTQEDELTPYDRLRSASPAAERNPANAPKVTVIIPAYNAADVIKTALDSVLGQTWTNLEVIVVDDASSDATLDISRDYATRDDRVKVVALSTNSGSYVARNRALSIATGDFVTCNDADDWSHPQKIETQVRNLLEYPHLVGNTSQQARATSDLRFHRRGNPGFYIFSNLSSLMFRRETVLAEVGYWDEVRVAGDGEFARRLKRVFGREAVVDLHTGPLSFQRKAVGSLTEHNTLGFQGFLTGARREYFESSEHFHRTSDSLKIDKSPLRRPFPAPRLMLPGSGPKDRRREFDVVIASDFRLVGGSTVSSVEEIKAHRQMGLRTGLVQLARYDFDPRRSITSTVRDLIDGESVEVLTNGDDVQCDLLIVRYPPVLQEWQRYVPRVSAPDIRVIINQTPMSDYGPDRVVRYELDRARDNLEAHFGKSGLWHPIGPLVRQALLDHHQDELSAIALSPDDWSNIIDVAAWRRQDRQRRPGPPRIGRHSRDHPTKWPGTATEMLAIYPDSPEYEVHVLGGDHTIKEVLGYVPDNWQVHPFGSVPPRDFLAELDVFVYYTHPDWVEAFGRVILEAMATGVPTVLPPEYKDLFGDAAVYAEPSQARAAIDRLLQDEEHYRAQTAAALRYVEDNFGYSMHGRRLKPMVRRLQRRQMG